MNASSVDPDQMLHSKASDLGLHYLPFTLYEVSRRRGVKQSCGNTMPDLSNLSHFPEDK